MDTVSHPELFYKYTAASTALIVLETSRLRWSSPFKFDDPAEFKRMPRFEPSISDVAKTFPEIMVKAALGEFPIRDYELTPSSRLLLDMTRLLISTGMSPSALITELGEIPEASDSRIESALREFFNDRFISTARVLCVAPIFDNDALWASYADNFKGCVLGFRHIPGLDTPLLAAKPVKYSEHAPVVGSGVDFLLYAGTRALKEATIDAICFTKKHHWSYQQEWRTVMWREFDGDKQYGDYKFYPEELESVTVGSAATQETLQSVAKLIESRYRKCSLYKLTQVGSELKRVQVMLNGIVA
ncbi:DUF2971 domain-containing protein [Luteimonas sp. 22616]|uniref:DUF2971 domain-containing protein n=1 Tax=Luteimonas sp. 22616 TaxID=3453951 RepID=UPI003F867FD1